VIEHADSRLFNSEDVYASLRAPGMRKTCTMLRSCGVVIIGLILLLIVLKSMKYAWLMDIGD
jgi:hypothetical protein